MILLLHFAEKIRDFHIFSGRKALTFQKGPLISFVITFEFLCG